MSVRVSFVDLDRRIGVVTVADDGSDDLPHRLRGTLAGLLIEAGWHVVVAFEDERPHRASVARVLEQARRWARDCGSRLSVAVVRDIAELTGT